MNKTSIEYVLNPDNTSGFNWPILTGCLHPCRKQYCYNTMKPSSPLNRFFKKNREKETDEMHFAFDDISYEKDVRRGIEILEGAGFKPRALMCYILAKPGGFDDAWRRQEIIWKEYGIDPFIQVYNNSREDHSIRRLARWCNKPQLRKICEFNEYRG